ncbi:DUF3311 domain-containing protein [Sulfodiicoccus acidiphilus]|nr:DUF3311 domain-containing protein [Sulfodiicoccus acidiphilus]
MNGRSVAYVVLCLLPFLLYGLISTYDGVQPSLGGLPFFYWYEMVLLVVAGVLYVIASLITRGRP